MTNYDFGDVVLVPFPFTDQSTSKKRPAVVVSSAVYNSQRSHLVLAAVTSQIKRPASFGELSVSEWKQAGLIKLSIIKPIFTTVDKGLVLKKLGQLQKNDKKALQGILKLILG